jgi:hypothetical protein
MGELSLVELKKENQQGRLPSHVYEMFVPLFKEIYNAEKIRKDMQTRIENNLDFESIENVLVWLRTPLGRKITLLEEAASSPEGQQQLGAFAKQLRTNPPSQARVHLGKRLDEATQATETTLELAVATSQEATFTKPGNALTPTEQLYFSMTIPTHFIEGANALLPKEQRIDYATFQQQMKSQPQKMKHVYQHANLANFLYTYQNLSDDELDLYIAFSESESGRNYHKTIFKALQKIQQDAALRITKAVGQAFAG